MFKYYSFKPLWSYFTKKSKYNRDNSNKNVKSGKKNIKSEKKIDIDNVINDIERNLPIDKKKSIEDILSVDKVSENQFLECFSDTETNNSNSSPSPEFRLNKTNDTFDALSTCLDDEDITNMIKKNNKIIENIKLYKIYIFDNKKNTYINVSSTNIF
jgi:hypothetical protein